MLGLNTLDIVGIVASIAAMVVVFVAWKRHKNKEEE